MRTYQTLFLALGLSALQPAFAQCEISSSLIRSFAFEGANYEIVLQNRSWQQAAACATARGGKLVEIGSQEEQDAVYFQISNAFIDPANTVAMDGGGASYLWLGGNDAASEGNWVWNGDNDTQASPFWTGTSNGSAVNGSYVNWGFEPDNWNGQDGLAMALTDWPLGEAGQWNDVFITDALYFIIEYPPFSLGEAENTASLFSVWPNPATDQLTVSLQSVTDVIVLTDVSGKPMLTEQPQAGNTVIDISALPAGMYLVQAGTQVRWIVID